MTQIDSELMMLSDSIRKDLEDALDLYEFTNQGDQIEAWIREKEVMVNASDVGRDYEHCKELERKLNRSEFGLELTHEDVKQQAPEIYKLRNEELERAYDQWEMI